MECKVIMFLSTLSKDSIFMFSGFPFAYSGSCSWNKGVAIIRSENVRNCTPTTTHYLHNVSGGSVDISKRKDSRYLWVCQVASRSWLGWVLWWEMWSHGLSCGRGWLPMHRKFQSVPAYVTPIILLPFMQPRNECSLFKKYREFHFRSQCNFKNGLSFWTFIPPGPNFNPVAFRTGFRIWKISTPDLEPLKSWKNSEFEVYHLKDILWALFKRISDTIHWLVHESILKMVLHTKLGDRQRTWVISRLRASAAHHGNQLDKQFKLKSRVYKGVSAAVSTTNRDTTVTTD